MYQVQNREELKQIIDQRKIPLDTLDTSLIRDMSELFCDVKEINGSISSWDVSSVENMKSIFRDSDLNEDISSWNVSKVKNMSMMFFNTFFDKNISSWNTSSAEDMSMMFAYSKFNGDISSWDISNTKHMTAIFQQASCFEQNLGAWDISGKDGIFIGSRYTLEKYKKDREEYLNIIENDKYIKEVEESINKELNKNIELSTLEMEF